MLTDSTVIMQSSESYEEMRLVRIGAASLAASRPPGLQKFIFDDAQGRDEVTFEWISSVLYCDELLSNRRNFPYYHAQNGLGGLYECIGSTYLERLHADLNVSAGSFKKHRHFVYWDEGFNWHITCESYSLLSVGG
jgi:hypothetical protein